MALLVFTVGGFNKKKEGRLLNGQARNAMPMIIRKEVNQYLCRKKIEHNSEK